eukprot:CAMPEP_0169326914 /NCGR_PEP_ID=MMETSP1017-20121227/11765_1 /TAXON_ID=342587 /ORGANISM="Karlodinium micrum, Strain CCMP2283" /LENGTH=78 /DNA_ID=CAMNT_0009421671 /DNA_START=200 /DNA_END=433 /DNA_ORIENTATION=+
MQLISKLLASPFKRMQPSQNSSISIDPEPSTSSNLNNTHTSDDVMPNASKYAGSSELASFKNIRISLKLISPPPSASI